MAPRRLADLTDVGSPFSDGEFPIWNDDDEVFEPGTVPGVAGADGADGPAGADGAQGPVGPAGEGFEFEGVWLIGTAYQANDVVHHDGAAWVALQGSTGEEPGAGSVFWDEFAVQGAEGVQGPVGPQGPAGVDGDDGAQGPQGVQGVPGADGAAGVDGDDGAQGPQGVPGPDNVIVGKTVPPLTAAEDGMTWVYDHASGGMVWVQGVAADDPRLSDARAPTAHTHDDRYYTEAEIDTDPRLGGYERTVRTSAMASMPRSSIVGSTGSLNAFIYSARAECLEAGTFNSIRLFAGATAPSGITAARAGVWLEDGTLEMETADFAASVLQNAIITQPLPSPLTLAAGDVRFLGGGVIGSTLPGWRGSSGLQAATLALAPILVRSRSGWAGTSPLLDLTITGGTGSWIFAELIP